MLSTKRLVLSTIVALISSGTVAANVHAFPEVDPSFNLQQIRLQEQDIRDGLIRSGQSAKPAAEGPSYGAVTNYHSAIESRQTIETDNPQAQLSLAERHRQSAARRNK